MTNDPPETMRVFYITDVGGPTYFDQDIISFQIE